MSQLSDIEIHDLRVVLEPARGKVPFAPAVSNLSVQIANSALNKAIAYALELGKDRAPVDVELRSTRFINEGAEIIIQVSKGRFFKTDVRALVALSAVNANVVRAEIKEVKGLGKLPIDGFLEPVLDKALGKAASLPGVTRSTDARRLLLIDPQQLLEKLGLPARLVQPGAWNVGTTDGQLEARYGTPPSSV
jgi:hypothetical protein